MQNPCKIYCIWCWNLEIIVLDKFWHVLTRFDKFRQVLTRWDKIGQDWPNLDKFEQDWANLDKFFRYNLDQLHLILKKSLDKLKQVWTSLDKFEQVWTILDKFIPYPQELLGLFQEFHASFVMFAHWPGLFHIQNWSRCPFLWSRQWSHQHHGWTWGLKIN